MASAAGARCGAVVWLSTLLLLGAFGAEYGFESYQPAMRTWGYTVVALLFGSILVLGITCRRTAGWLSVGWLRLFGKYSYAIYLPHYLLWFLVGAHLWQPTLFGSRLPAQILACLVMGLMSLAIGWLCWNLVERRALAFKRCFPIGEAISTPGLSGYAGWARGVRFSP